MKGILYCDGGSRGNPGPSAAGWVIYDESGKIIKKDGLSTGIQTNNFAEYTSLVEGLKQSLEKGITELWVRMDSKLSIEQMKGNWKVKHINLKPLFERAKALEEDFEIVHFDHVRREKNKVADSMVNQVLDAL